MEVVYNLKLVSPREPILTLLIHEARNLGVAVAEVPVEPRSLNGGIVTRARVTARVEDGRVIVEDEPIVEEVQPK